MRRHDACHRVEDAVDPARVLALPAAQHLADAHALQVLLAAAEVARNDRELALLGPALEVALGDVGERADDDVAAVVADQLGRHALQPAAEEHVHEQRRHHVVAMVAERDLGRAELARDAIEHAAAQARAEAAHRPAFGDEALDDRVGVLLDDPVVDAEPGQVLGQHLGRKARLLLVEVDGDDRELDRRALAQLDQDVEQRVAVLAARDADHDAVAVLDHREVGDRAADLAMQALLQLGDLDRELAARRGVARARGAGGGGSGVGESGGRDHDSYNAAVHESLDDSSVSAALARLIGVAIDRAGGWIPFSRFMAIALYAPGLGYYASGRTDRRPDAGVGQRLRHRARAVAAVRPRPGAPGRAGARGERQRRGLGIRRRQRRARRRAAGGARRSRPPLLDRRAVGAAARAPARSDARVRRPRPLARRAAGRR